MSSASLHQLVLEPSRELRAAAYAESVALRAECRRWLARTRFPFDPIERLAHLRGIDTITGIARWLGCSREQIYRIRGGMSWLIADRIATHLNMHPTAIWPDWADDVDLEEAS